MNKNISRLKINWISSPFVNADDDNNELCVMTHNVRWNHLRSGSYPIYNILGAHSIFSFTLTEKLYTWWEIIWWCTWRGHKVSQKVIAQYDSYCVYVVAVVINLWNSIFFFLISLTQFWLPKKNFIISYRIKKKKKN